MFVHLDSHHHLPILPTLRGVKCSYYVESFRTHLINYNRHALHMEYSSNCQFTNSYIAIMSQETHSLAIKKKQQQQTTTSYVLEHKWQRACALVNISACSRKKLFALVIRMKISPKFKKVGACAFWVGKFIGCITWRRLEIQNK